MDDIILVKPGIDPIMYYRHVCTRCDAIAEIKGTLVVFTCPHCTYEEPYIQSQDCAVKKYVRVGGTPRQIEPRQIERTISKSIKKGKIF